MRALSLGLTVALSVAALPALADDAQPQEALGEAKTCVPLTLIRQSHVINDETIVFRARGANKYYLNKLPNRCPRLAFNKSFTYATSLTQLCNVDIITVLEQFGGRLQRGPSCGLGMFEPITKDQFAELKQKEKDDRKARKEARKAKKETSR